MKQVRQKPFHRLSQIEAPDGGDIDFTYDLAGRMTLEDAVNNVTTWAYEYVFDDLDRLTDEKWLTDGDPVPALSISTTTPGGRPTKCSAWDSPTAGALREGRSRFRLAARRPAH